MLGDIISYNVYRFDTSLESIFAAIHEGEKGQQIDKKGHKGKPVVENAVVAQTLDIHTDAEVHLIEDGAVLMNHEVSGTGTVESVLDSVIEAGSFPKRKVDSSEEKKPSESTDKDILEEVFNFNTHGLIENFDRKCFSIVLKENVISEGSEPGSKQESTKKTLNGSKGALNRDKEDDLENSQFRWIFPPHESKEFMLKFNSDHIGKIKQTLNFGITGFGTK